MTLEVPRRLYKSQHPRNWGLGCDVPTGLDRVFAVAAATPLADFLSRGFAVLSILGRSRDAGGSEAIQRELQAASGVGNAGSTGTISVGFSALIE